MRAKRDHQAGIQRLRRVPLFAGCDDDELLEIDGLVTEIRVEAGQHLTREGAGGREFIVVLDGDVRITRDDDDVAVLGPGSFLGELALLDGSPRAATATAVTAVRALVMNGGEFAALLQANPGLRAKVERAAAERR